MPTLTPHAVEATASLRLLPTPRSEPPYDDETGKPVCASVGRPGDGGAVQGTLALSFVLPSGLAVAPEQPHLRLVPRVHEDARCNPPTPRLLPEPRAWAGRFVQALVEVLAGDRPVTQLVRWTDADVFATVQRRVTVSALRCPPGRSGARRSVLRSLHVSEPQEGVAEVCALVQNGPRLRALALRLDGLGGRWQCTALELG